MTYADLEARLRNEQHLTSTLIGQRDAAEAHVRTLRETIALNEREILRLARACDGYERQTQVQRDLIASINQDRDDLTQARPNVEAELARMIARRNGYQHDAGVAREENDRLRCLLNARDAEIATFKDVQQGQDALVARLMGVIAAVKAALVGVDVDPSAPYVDEYGPIGDDDIPF